MVCTGWVNYPKKTKTDIKSKVKIMKKTMLFVAALFFMIGATTAQKRVYFGVKGGLNASSLSSSGATQKLGFNAGALMHIHTNSNAWGIQPELIYSLEGAKIPVIGNNDKANLNLSYLNVPVLVQYMWDNGFRVEAGPQFGFLVGAKSKLGSSNIDVKDNYNTFNFSVPVGLGYLTRSGLGFDARYNIGVSNINKGSGTLRANTFQFGIFYQFDDTKMK